MKKKNITKRSLEQIKKEKDKTRKDAKEGPSLGKDFWANAEVVVPSKPKKQLTLRLDEDLVEFFKEGGSGYQTRMNAVLRSYVQAQKTTNSS